MIKLIRDSGLVGGDIVLHLLLRGQPPSHIRIADLSPPARPDLLRGAAAQVDFVSADISDRSSMEAAFARPWPPSASGLPLTVFHTAAAIRPAERSQLVWDRTRRVNVDGTQHCLAAARQAGADIFVFTSSVSVALRPCEFLVPPWAQRPRRWFQVLDEADFDDAVGSLRPKDQFFGNYAYSKALAETLVGEANSPGFRTGCVRPGMGIYGMPKDLVYADFLGKTGTVATCCATVIQSVVSSRNVSLAHLCFEAALQQQQGKEDMVPRCAGRPLVVTDPGPPPSWQDFFRAARLLSSSSAAGSPPSVTSVPPVPLWLLAHAVEAWSLLLARFPGLTRAPFWLREPRGDVRLLQPAVFSPMAFIMCADDRARKGVAEGGIGYRGAMDSLEGVCELLRDWNRAQEGGRGGPEAVVAA